MSTTVTIIYKGPVVDEIRQGMNIPRLFNPDNSYVDSPVYTEGYPNEKGVPEAAVPQDGRFVLVASGECRGHIATEKKGEGGFGYDPVFVPDGYSNSFAELGTDFKNTISHRAKALAELERLLG